MSPATFTACLHILVIFAGNVPTIGRTLLNNNMGRTLQQLLVQDRPAAQAETGQTVNIEIIPRSPQVKTNKTSRLLGNLFKQSHDFNPR